ncbi:uncharacterized protein ATC70_008186 [Mucor velutinosus]|uniref:Uncharacterized protein n=1 Tax=Mucor velutinosus TaxID=708070 RepID=A0AAN7I353_9FUNG|nr:hypothetical protein ATC70_008186 [Mucor velutinosus]
MPSSREKEDSKKEFQEEGKKPKISEHVIAKLPPVDQIDTENKSKKNRQKEKDSIPSAKATTAATPAAIPTPASLQPAEQQPAEQQSVAMVQMGGGLPALPPRPSVPQRQAQASVSSAFSNGKIAQRLPNVKQVSTPQFNVPAGSDLGAVGKIGAYQMAQIKPKNTSSATQIHTNMIFWVCALLFVTMFIMKKQ